MCRICTIALEWVSLVNLLHISVTLGTIVEWKGEGKVRLILHVMVFATKHTCFLDIYSAFSDLV